VSELGDAGRYADSRVTTEPTTPPPSGSLPPREPRSLFVHFGVDSAVAFLALIMLGLLLGVPWGVVAVIALVIGGIACRYTRRAEIRALAARQQASS
jgi:hypothetical protein